MLATRYKDQRGMTLIELLVGIVIGGIVTAMLITTWLALNEAFTSSVNSNIARDSARQAVSHMEREIRDAQAGATGSMILDAHPYWIRLSTTFNDPKAATSTTAPHQVVYRLYTDNSLWRYSDVDRNGTVSGIVLTNYRVSDRKTEQTTGEGRSLVIRNVANTLGTDTPLFMYNYYASAGTLVSTEAPAVISLPQIQAVQIHLLVDANPDHPPAPADFLTIATLRNY